MGTGPQGVCFGGTVGSTLMWYGGPGNLPMPSKTSGILLFNLLIGGDELQVVSVHQAEIYGVVPLCLL